MPKGQWTPPDAGNAPQEVKDILRSVYADFRDKNPAEEPAVKAKGAKIAWGAVEAAGWHKGEDGKWVKKVKDSIEILEALDAAADDPGAVLEELLGDIDAFLAKSKDTIKGKLGSPAIRSFLREVKSKLRGMLKNLEETDRKGVEEMVKKLEERMAPIGSFESIKDVLTQALKDQQIISPEPGSTSSYVYVDYMFPDRIIASSGNKMYSIPYAFMDGKVTFGEKTEVDETTLIVTKEAETAPQETKVTDIRERGMAVDSLQVSDFISLREAKVSADGSEVEVILIEAGTNEGKRRHYPIKTIEEAAPHFAGLKNYINHPTPAEEKQRPERDLREWGSTITESWFANGQARARVAIHDSWLRERLQDPVARAHIGLSINTGGITSRGKVNGKDNYEIVEKIVFTRKNGPPSVDWVTEPGARGRVAQLFESRRRETTMDLKELRETHGDLLNVAIKEATEPIQKKLDEQTTALTEANKKIAEFEGASKLAKQGEAVEKALKESKAPDAVKDRVRDHFKATIVEGDETKLKEAIAGVMKSELAYASKINPKSAIDFNTGEATNDGKPLKESIAGELDKRAGIEEPKKDGKE